MGKYVIIVKLKNGDEVHSHVIADSQDEAVTKLYNNDIFMDFVANNEYERIDIETIHDDDVLDKERYAVNESKENPGLYSVVDLDSRIRIDFEKGKFNETQKLTWIGNERVIDALEGAMALRSIADYLQKYYPELLE